MKLRDYTLEAFAKMVVGDHQAFPYRRSGEITSFFTRCDMDYRHGNETRWRWALGVLAELNQHQSRSPDLPSESLLRVIFELFDDDDFDRAELPREPALEEFNRLMARDGLAAYFDPSGRAHVRNTGSGIHSSAVTKTPRPLSKEEVAQREKVEAFLAAASEDEFTERLLVPLFQRLGFYRVSPAGHARRLLSSARIFGR
jgi:hypothetical protein